MPTEQLPSHNSWITGRRFSVDRALVLNHVRLNPGLAYAAAEFGRVRIPGGRTRPVTAEERELIYPHIMWEDEPKPKISRELKRLIELHPTSRFVRGFVRAEIGIVPAKEETPQTTEDWLKYVEETEPIPSAPHRNPIFNWAVTPNRDEILRQWVATEPLRIEEVIVPEIQNPDDTIMVTVSGAIRQSGTASFSRTTHMSGTIPVPRELFQLGRLVIERYIEGNYDHLESYDWTNYEYGDHDVDHDEDGTFSIVDSDLRQRLDAFESGRI